MLINKIYINNFKSLVDLSIINPEPFTVFFGTNAAGKSNLFEALELVSFALKSPNEPLKFFGEFDEVYNVQKYDDNNKDITVRIETTKGVLNLNLKNNPNQNGATSSDEELNSILINNFTRLFLGNKHVVKEIFKDDLKLMADGSNLERVLGRLIKDSVKKDDIREWLKFIIPEFENLEIKQDKLTGEDYLIVWEQNSSVPFTGNLISDGTRNSISLLTALYQSDSPQFLLVEEPENGLNPKVIKEFVAMCRELCEDRKHQIWIVTHSQTLVSEVTTQEGILVYKNNGFSSVKQFKDLNLHGLKMDQAWLSNVLGGGIPW
jgi:predicted ATPase